MAYGVPEAYEERIAPRYAPVAAGLVDLAEPGTADDVLELGAGTGLVTRVAAPAAGRYLATDKAPAMLEVARALAPGALFAVLDYGAPLPFLDASFDVVLSGLTYAQDSAGTVGEIARVLRPGGRVALSMWGEDYLEFR